MDDDNPRFDPLRLHIAFWFVLSMGLLAAFVVLYGAQFLSALVWLFAAKPDIP